MQIRKHQLQRIKVVQISYLATVSANFKTLICLFFQFFLILICFRYLLKKLLVPGNLHTSIFLLYLLTVVLYKNVLCGIHSEIL